MPNTVHMYIMASKYSYILYDIHAAYTFISMFSAVKGNNCVTLNANRIYIEGNIIFSIHCCIEMLRELIGNI